jgi:hypothetical protein
MRPLSRKFLSRSIWSLLLLACLPAKAETTRILRAELAPGDLAHFSVENLAGRMHVSRWAGDAVAAVATVHAADEKLAQTVSLERVPGENGRVALRVRYASSQKTVRYVPDTSGSRFLSWLEFSWDSMEYDGRRMRVSKSHGPILYVDVEVQVPGRLADATFLNKVGRLNAEDLEGRISFEVASADIVLGHLNGEIRIEGGSGDVRAKDIGGSWSSRFGSGDCRLETFHGDSASFHTGSGDVHASSIDAKKLEVETGSGDSHFGGARVEEFAGRAGSGNIDLDASAHLPSAISVTTSSGNVDLRLPPDAAFEAVTRHGSGDVSVRFEDVLATLHDGKITGYRRGSGAGAKITARTGSGDLTITP